MAQLKERHRQIPWGLKYTEPITNWRARPFSSFDSIVNHLIGICRGNPALAEKHHWECTYEFWANRVDAFNTAICEKMGWTDYITSGDLGGATGSVPFKEKTVRHSSLQKRVGAVVADTKHAVAGIGLVMDWLGDELLPVPIERAEQRASVCTTRFVNGEIKPCPQNQDPNWLEKLTGKAAEEIRQLMGVSNELALRTKFDDRLHTCKPCGCFLKLKVHVDLKHILKHMKEDVKAKLDRDCWITKEEQNESTTITPRTAA